MTLEVRTSAGNTRIDTRMIYAFSDFASIIPCEKRDEQNHVNRPGLEDPLNFTLDFTPLKDKTNPNTSCIEKF